MDLLFDLDEALARTEISREDIQKLRNPLPPGTPTDITDKQLCLFLNACDRDIACCQRVIQAYYKERKHSPEFFDNRDPASEPIKEAFQGQYYAVLPVTPDGYHVVYYGLRDPNPSTFHFEVVTKIFSMMIDACISLQGPQKGIIFMYDMKDVGWRHSMKCSIGGVKKTFHYMQECLPVKLRRLHVMNSTPFYNVILRITKPFMKPEVFQIIRTHKSTMDQEAFFRTSIPKSCTPSDYGGDCPSVEELSRDFYQQLISMREYFLWEEKQRKGEKKK